jgi:hypothetical protein
MIPNAASSVITNAITKCTIIRLSPRDLPTLVTAPHDSPDFVEEPQSTRTHDKEKGNDHDPAGCPVWRITAVGEQSDRHEEKQTRYHARDGFAQISALVALGTTDG